MVIVFRGHQLQCSEPVDAIHHVDATHGSSEKAAAEAPQAADHEAFSAEDDSA